MREIIFLVFLLLMSTKARRRTEYFADGFCYGEGWFCEFAEPFLFLITFNINPATPLAVTAGRLNAVTVAPPKALSLGLVAGNRFALAAGMMDPSQIDSRRGLRYRGTVCQLRRLRLLPDSPSWEFAGRRACLCSAYRDGHGLSQRLFIAEQTSNSRGGRGPAGARIAQDPGD